MPRPFGVPWFMFDIDNKQFITSRTIPSEITDTKDIILTETPVPGLNYAPIMPGGGGNRKVSFTLPIVQRNGQYGNLAILKQFDLLRQQIGQGLSVGVRQFNRMPKVRFYWGVGSVPLVYWVSKIEFTHKGEMVNGFGMPKFTDVSVELILDETDPVYRAEEAFRAAQAWLGKANAVATNVVALFGGRPY